VAGLTAVHPEGRGVIDCDRESRELCCAVRYCHESRVKSDLAGRGSELELATGIAEARLCSSVVLLLEFKGDRVADSRGEGARAVSQGRSADDDDVVRSAGGGARARASGSTSGGSSGRRGSACCGRLESGELGTGVDGKDHALFAVALLSAVGPNGLVSCTVKTARVNWEV